MNQSVSLPALKVSRRRLLHHGLTTSYFVLGASALVACQANAPAATPAPSPATPATAAPTPATSVPHGSGIVNVLYAGSLVTLLEKHVGPAFNTATGFTFQGEGKGSVAIANLIKGKTRTPDVFISADPSVNALLEGSSNGNYVSWWVPFARTALVVAWSPRSRFAGDFTNAKDGKRTWESVLEEPGLHLGRTDPALDPKGYRTLWLFQLDEARTGNKGEAQRILGSPTNPAQIFPEEQLVARLQGGQLDAGIFYQIEAVEAHLPYLELPASINQGEPAQAAHYATVSYINSKGTTFKGSPIIYTVTIPSTVHNETGAASFVQFLFSEAGQKLLIDEGLLSTVPVVSGNSSAVPSLLQSVVK
ncbi:MAG TPA: extracellular solute-binding protein [Chloroflexota bacterium]|nr:extracellular solute-binding protein [Chloroflexota bacterium]